MPAYFTTLSDMLEPSQQDRQPKPHLKLIFNQPAFTVEQHTIWQTPNNISNEERATWLFLNNLCQNNAWELQWESQDNYRIIIQNQHVIYALPGQYIIHLNTHYVDYQTILQATAELALARWGLTLPLVITAPNTNLQLV